MQLLATYPRVPAGSAHQPRSWMKPGVDLEPCVVAVQFLSDGWSWSDLMSLGCKDDQQEMPPVWGLPGHSRLRLFTTWVYKKKECV
eukprot:gene8621-8802_t